MAGVMAHDVGKVHDCARVAGVEYRCESTSGRKRFDQEVVAGVSGEVRYHLTLRVNFILLKGNNEIKHTVIVDDQTGSLVIQRTDGCDQYGPSSRLRPTFIVIIDFVSINVFDHDSMAGTCMNKQSHGALTNARTTHRLSALRRLTSS